MEESWSSPSSECLSNKVLLQEEWIVEGIRKNESDSSILSVGILEAEGFPWNYVNIIV